MPPRKVYLKLKGRGICTACGTRKAEVGVKCVRCHAQICKRQTERWKTDSEYKKRMGRHAAREKDKRRKEGRCTCCGTPLHEEADEGFTHCINCRQHLFRTDPQLYPEEIERNADNQNINTGPLQFIFNR